MRGIAWCAVSVVWIACHILTSQSACISAYHPDTRLHPPPLKLAFLQRERPWSTTVKTPSSTLILQSKDFGVGAWKWRTKPPTEKGVPAAPIVSSRRLLVSKSTTESDERPSPKRGPDGAFINEKTPSSVDEQELKRPAPGKSPKAAEADTPIKTQAGSQA